MTTKVTAIKDALLVRVIDEKVATEGTSKEETIALDMASVFAASGDRTSAVAVLEKAGYKLCMCLVKED